MKKLSIILTVFTLGLFLCGCTQTVTGTQGKQNKQPNICTDTREWDVFDTSEEHVSAIYDYHMQCIVNPSIAKNEYTDETLESLIFLADRLDSGYMDKIPDRNNKYKLVITWTFETIFGNTAYNIADKYKEFRDDPIEYANNYEWYLKEAVKAYNKSDLQNKIEKLVKDFEKAGYFNDYRVVDIFTSELLEFALKTDSLDIYEPLLFKVAKYNNNKPQAIRNAIFYGEFLYQDENYYKKFE